MNTASESSADPVDGPRSATSSTGFAAATLRALRAGNLDEPAAPAPPPPIVADAVIEDAAVEDAAVEDAVIEDAVIEDAVIEDAVVEDAAPPTARRSLVTAACAVVAVAALVFALVAGVVWWRAGHSSERRIGIAREQVKKDAYIAISTVNTSDYRHPSAALDNWLDASTGSLHDQFSQSRSTAIKLLAQARMVTKAKILRAAVTSVDLKKGTATVIASVNVTRTPATGSVSTVRNRFRASMTRTGGQWKLSNLAVVPVSLS